MMSSKRRKRTGAAKIAANLAVRVERGARKAAAKAKRATTPRSGDHANG
jgi:hypothetical protein